jgi:hypothetical protein
LNENAVVPVNVSFEVTVLKLTDILFDRPSKLTSWEVRVFARRLPVSQVPSVKTTVFDPFMLRYLLPLLIKSCVLGMLPDTILRLDTLYKGLLNLKV